MNLFIYFLFMIEILLQGRTKEEAQRSPVPYGPYENNQIKFKLLYQVAWCLPFQNDHSNPILSGSSPC